MVPASVNREVALLAACCRPLDDPRRPAAVCDAAASEIDWAHLLRLATRHRVQAQVVEGLRAARVKVPDHAQSLANGVAAAASHRLALTAETLRLSEMFGVARIPMLTFKGASLDMLAYRRTGFKHSRDIDLLVAAEDLCRAEDLLAGLGYVCEVPSAERSKRLRADPKARRRFLRRDKEVVWRRGNLIVEVHWRPATSRFLLPGVNVGSRHQTVELAPGRSLATLVDEDLFAYLALHGAQHGWCRLKWLADLIAFVARMPDGMLVRLHEHAEALRVGRCSAQALLLGEQFLGLRLPCEFARQLRSDRVVRAMVAFGSSVLSAEVPVGRAEDQARFRGRLLMSHWQSSSYFPYRVELIASSLNRLTSGHEWRAALRDWRVRSEARSGRGC